jgi:2-polyprenyl-3-methyl-5-hydroxy-6-metoxy-1,4-benzoquinol methylase
MLHGMRDEFDYFECSECGCVQISEIPSDLARYYPSDYFSFRRHRNLERNFVRRFIDPRRVKGSFGRSDILGAVAEWVSRPFDYVKWVQDAGLGPDARVLDIGCGAGKTLLNMALGGFPSPTGVDPFIPETLHYSCSVIIHKVKLQDFARDHAGSFDFVMLHNSLEHMTAPLAALIAVESLLSPRGCVLVAIPVADSWAWRHYRENWFALDPPRHIHLLTTRAMGILADGAGLKILKRRQTGNLSQFTGSERYRRGIAMSEGPRDRQLFNREDLRRWSQRAKELNQQERSDLVIFMLGRK